MNGLKLAVYVILGISALGNILSIGRNRPPVTPGMATFGVLLSGLVAGLVAAS